MKLYIIWAITVFGVSLLGQIVFLLTQNRERDLRATAGDAVVSAVFLAWGAYILGSAGGTP